MKNIIKDERMSKTYNLMCIFGCLLAGGIMACSGGAKQAEEETMENLLPETASEVTVQTLQFTDFHHELVSNGKLTATQYVDLHFESAEPIAAIWVKNGDRVSKGQKLAELATFRLTHKTAQAKDALDRAMLEQQDVLIGQGFALTDTAKIPPEIKQLARTRSGYEQSLIQYQLAVYEEEHATLKAPFDGIVANLFAKPYNMASTSEVFCTLFDAHAMEASFTVLESELPLIKKGDKVKVVPYFATLDKAIEGLISDINPLVETNGSVRVKAKVPNPGNLFEGMNVKVSIQRSLGQQLVIPKSAVVIRSGKQVAFTLVGGKAYWNYIHTGLENSDSYTLEASNDGLKEGDIVITSGNINLAHESAVTVKHD
jgi:RND family efflux transporter MFP subunit